jgi:hypothetical protein
LWLTGFNVLFILAVRTEATFGIEPRKVQSNSFTIEFALEAGRCLQEEIDADKTQLGPCSFHRLKHGQQSRKMYWPFAALKEVHVMTLTLGGSVKDHLALHPQLEMGNFIIKAVWLPVSKRDAIELIKNVKQSILR